MPKKKRKKRCRESTSSPSSADSGPSDGDLIRQVASEFSTLLSALADRVKALEQRAQQPSVPSVLIQVDGSVGVNMQQDEVQGKAGFKKKGDA